MAKSIISKKRNTVVRGRIQVWNLHPFILIAASQFRLLGGKKEVPCMWGRRVHVYSRGSVPASLFHILPPEALDVLNNPHLVPCCGRVSKQLHCCGSYLFGASTMGTDPPGKTPLGSSRWWVGEIPRLWKRPSWKAPDFSSLCFWMDLPNSWWEPLSNINQDVIVKKSKQTKITVQAREQLCWQFVFVTICVGKLCRIGRANYRTVGKVDFGLKWCAI